MVSQMVQQGDLVVLKQTEEVVLMTPLVDRRGIPVFVGDLIKVSHFIARNRRKVYMYKMVLVVNGRVYAIDNRELGFKPSDRCHKCLLEDCSNFEVIDGPSVDHPITGELICFWERKKLAGDKTVIECPIKLED